MSTTVPAASTETRAQVPTGRGPRVMLTDRARHERRLGWWLAGPAFVLMVGVTAYPILNAIYLSLFEYRLTDPDAQRFIALGNYWTIVTDALFWRQFAVTAGITIVTVAVEFVLGFALALVMHRALYLRRLLRTSILIP